MNQYEMLDKLKLLIRRGHTTLSAFEKTIKAAGGIVNKYNGTDALFVDASALEWRSIETTAFLASCVFLDVKMVGMIEERSSYPPIAKPYIRVTEKAKS
jgi:hypothetical protein